MKKGLILVAFFICTSLAVSAQGFYFDIGHGLGKAWTLIDGDDLIKELKSAGKNVNEIAVDLSSKAGYGPFGNIPLYVVGELGGIGHRIYNSSDYIQFNSYIIGPGVIFYPISLIQLGLSIGYSFAANKTDISYYQMYNSKEGFAWNISAAVDLSRKNHGHLIGIKYFNANNTLEVSNVGQKTSMISIFVKYTHRKKVSLLF